MTMPGMSDGRCFTNFLPNCEYNEVLKNKFQLNSNNKYRTYLQENAESIMNDMKKICSDSTSAECSTCLFVQDLNYSENKM